MLVLFILITILFRSDCLYALHLKVYLLDIEARHMLYITSVKMSIYNKQFCSVRS